ncbi:16606_t:CDS:2 [Funneliformis geosporum]|uniref:13915_t:CDS:1 n=1 Tax=Funneliformis geosporum TaxID=1117311 RepID=A0A9W4WX02_9GLOM|nr:16606_t:CDS:2 [Funneliformis geosporum]CAI2169838.1 13915_t:CDS:2 [Funneliformis geosporum]
MKKSLVTFLVVTLLTSLVATLDDIVVTSPTTDQKIGSTVDVKWDTSQIPKGLKTTDNVSVRIRCGKRQFPPKAVRREPFTVGIKAVDLSDDPDLIGVTCKASVWDEDNDNITGYSEPFKLIE